MAGGDRASPKQPVEVDFSENDIAETSFDQAPSPPDRTMIRSAPPVGSPFVASQDFPSFSPKAESPLPPIPEVDSEASLLQNHRSPSFGDSENRRSPSLVNLTEGSNFGDIISSEEVPHGDDPISSMQQVFKHAEEELSPASTEATSTTSVTQTLQRPLSMTDVCVVCLSADPDAVHMLPCSHCCMCAGCTTELLKSATSTSSSCPRTYARCPLCREPFRRSVKSPSSDDLYRENQTCLNNSLAAPLLLSEDTTSSSENHPFSVGSQLYCGVTAAELSAIEPGMSVALLGILHASELQSYRQLRERFLRERAARLERAVVSAAVASLTETDPSVLTVTEEEALQERRFRLGRTNPNFRRLDDVDDTTDASSSSSLRGHRDQQEALEIPAQDSVLCPCGAHMRRVRAQDAYPASLGCPVECDVCNRAIRGTGGVFHCDGERNPSHPFGFDLCPDCALGPNNNMESRPDQNDPFVTPRTDATPRFVDEGNRLRDERTVSSSPGTVEDPASFSFRGLLSRLSNLRSVTTRRRQEGGNEGRCLTQPNRLFGTVVGAVVGGLAAFLMLPPRAPGQGSVHGGNSNSGSVSEPLGGAGNGTGSVPLLRPRRRSLE